MTEPLAPANGEPRAPGSRPARRARRRWTRPALVLAPILLLALPYALLDPEPLDVADASAASGGAFLELPSGRTHYEASGPEAAPTVFLVHGTTMPAIVWDRTAPALAAAGLRVVRYDLYGRGLSTRPEASYDTDLYVAQLDGIVSRLAPDASVDLVGYSMGGIVVAEFARRHPERVRKLVLIAPAGVGTALPPLARLVTLPGAGEYLMHVVGERQLKPSRRNVLHPELHGGLDSAYLTTVRYRGSRRAVLGSLRRMPFTDYSDGYRALGALGKPVMLVWGRHDQVVPFTNAEAVRDLVRAERLVVIEGAGHLSSYEQPAEVNAALIEFLGDASLNGSR
jgi:pimeloyl-ACP methyl ester carboxylesterase